MRKYVQTFLLVVISVLATLTCVDTFKPDSNSWSGGFNNGFGCSTESITNMYAGYIEEWKKEVSSAFDEAESKILGKKPKPDIVGPHPDPDKCICGGSGWIEQGDGHKTRCPYHGTKMKTMKNSIKDSDLKDYLIVQPLILEE